MKRHKTITSNKTILRTRATPHVIPLYKFVGGPSRAIPPPPVTPKASHSIQQQNQKTNVSWFGQPLLSFNSAPQCRGAIPGAFGMCSNVDSTKM